MAHFLKKFLFLTVFLAFFASFSQKTPVFLNFLIKESENTAFQKGELLKYKISYGKQSKNKGLLPAGYATFTTEKTINNNYLFKGFGQTTKLFSLFMKVKHEYESIVDSETLNTIQFIMKIEEGKYFNTDSILFKTPLLNLDNHANDILSTYYKLRSVSEAKLLDNDTLFFSYYYNGHIIQSYILNLGEEIIKTKFGEIKTIKWSPLLEKGRMFSETTGAFIWVTADPMHIPVKVEFPVLVGSIYVNLIAYKGTVNNLN